MRRKTLQEFYEEVRKHKGMDVVSSLKKNKRDLISFSGKFDEYCIGFVDLVNSTKIAARLKKDQACRFYAAFLNAMALVVKEFGAKIVKNTGDSLMFYFPKDDSNVFAKSLECGLEMIRVRQILNEMMREQNLPTLHYRVSLDYGTAMIAKQIHSQENDLFGPSINMCSKINHLAKPNSLVIGGDLHEIVKSNRAFRFIELPGYSSGLGVAYPIYSVISSEADEIL